MEQLFALPAVPICVVGPWIRSARPQSHSHRWPGEKSVMDVDLVDS